MKAITMLAMAVVLLFPVSGLCADSADRGGVTTEVTIRIMFDSQEVIVEMLDNPASRDFMSLLPLKLDFSDFAKAEKVATLPRRLRTQGSPTPREATGDFTYYAPWGNLAVFYHGSGSDGQLYVLGRITSNKKTLASMKRNFTATIEKIE